MEINELAPLLGNWTQSKGSLHGRLSDAFERGIAQGLILPGTRLPAERTLAKALALSRTTVLTAYSNLKADGWLESRTGSGTWVSNRRASVARHRTHDAIVHSVSTANVMQVDESEMINFAAGTTVPLRELPREIFVADAETQNALLGERSYMPLGLPRLRDAVARMYSSKGLPTTFDQILITSGAQQALSLITSLYIQRGDTVLVENPTYFGALDVFRLAGARLSTVAVGPEHVQKTMLRDRIRTASPRLIYLTPTHQNPTGANMPELTRQGVGSLSDEFGIPLIEDHTLSELTIEGTTPGFVANYSRSGIVLVVGSMSKLFWGGLRVGWIRGPVAAIAQLSRIKTGSDLGSALITHAIAVQLLNAMDQAKAIRREQLRGRRDCLISLLREKLPQWEFTPPQGGLFLWVRLPRANTRDFAQCAARHGVAVTPGSAFAADESCLDHLRIPFVLDESLIADGVNRLGFAWSQYKMQI